MKLLLENWRKFINEAAEHDDAFKTLMDAGWNGIKQAMELADHLGIPSQELPWDFKSVSDYVYETGGPHGGVPGETERELLKNQLANVGWTLDDWVAAVRQDAIDFNARFSRERKQDLRESVDFENWRQYLKDHDLDELPFGPTTGPMARSGPESYKFKSPEERWEYTKWKYPKAKRHDLGITWEDFYHALFSGRGRKLADYVDESAEEYERRRAKEKEEGKITIDVGEEK